jgi:hypothetical protein
MIDPSFDTVTVDERYPTVEALQQKVADLENKLSLKAQSWELASRQLQQRVAQIESFEQELKANPWDFDGETLNDLARFFDITLEREYEVTLTVTFSGTVTVPYDYDIDDLENDLQAEIMTHHYGNSSVEVEFSEESMEIDYHEM